MLINGAQLHATGDITLVSAGNTELKALKNREHGWQHGKLIDKTYQQGVEIQSGGALNILAGGHLLFQAANLKAQRTMDIAAQGGYLYAQAMEETEHYEEKRKSCNRWTLCLTKNSEHRTYCHRSCKTDPLTII
ncbi:hemagglutinin repeat-containing protein [Arsenophonus nasoniae]|uniref:Hemagglutinin repeat-containing protein n=1 Tax=Arsenophonus nasoniae TaxID=638 RepID=A0AA95GDF1_9GAMM|nr:hemagglutinin repeat-containing protein [Arsenophonus nasoniae]WGL94135.1 hemagglutinin repeat-containing protein [Arsenophonus nasoniae]